MARRGKVVAELVLAAFTNGDVVHHRDYRGDTAFAARDWSRHPKRHVSLGLLAAMQNRPWAEAKFLQPACGKWRANDVALLGWIADAIPGFERGKPASGCRTK